MLAMRGWGPEAFARVSPGFLALIRFGLFAESIAPEITEIKAVMAMEPPAGDAKARLALARQKIAAEKRLTILRMALMLDEDVDG